MELAFQRKQCLLALTVSLIFITPKDFAGSYKAYGVSTRPESMGGAFVAVADDASAIYYNPAGLTQIKDTGMIFDLAPVLPHSTYTNSLNNVKVSNNQPALSVGNFFSKRINDKVSVGVGFYAPFARTTKYPASPALFDARFRTLVLDINITPVIAYKASEKLSFGLGPTLNYNIMNVNVFGFKQNAKGPGLSGVLSTLYALSDSLKIGATYHSHSSMNIRGHGRFPPFINANFRLKYKNPAYLDLGVALQASQKLLLALGVGWEYWARAKNATYYYSNNTFNSTITFNPRNSYDVHAGLEYYFKENQALRLGYAFFQRALPPEGVLPGALDFSANVLSVGYSYRANKQWQLNLGYEYASSQDVISTTPLLNPFVGRYHARVNTFLFGVNYQT